MITKYEIIFEKAKSNTDASNQMQRERTNEASVDTIILWKSLPKINVFDIVISVLLF